MPEVNIDDMIARNVRAAAVEAIPNANVLLAHKQVNAGPTWFIVVESNGIASSAEVRLSHKWAFADEIRKAFKG